MNQEDQGKKTSPVVSDAAVKKVIPAKPDKPAALSDEDLDKVAGGVYLPKVVPPRQPVAGEWRKPEISHDSQ